MPRTTVIKTISLDPGTVRKGNRLAKKYGFKKNFSGVVSKLIEDDDARLRHETADSPRPRALAGA